MIGALIILIGLQVLGTVITRLTGAPVPGPVFGLVILFVVLSLRGTTPPALSRTSNTLIDHLALLFVPAGVGIVNHLHILERHGLAIIVILITSAITTTIVTAATFAGVTRLMNRR
ncbi:CidA/LrgA family protein [Salinisphaera sp. USBA-960]|uniref:CidA/LrgA family protein n=1 Tax=Salinisphaera orenii TaxID=856731 RepID=UPI000DBE4B93|nr:CidA/LrgA family protein [Salifodinibacter halophilus]NNC26159.1 CidA/LrgA family protein [Salifodinibacter halophilus]